MNEETLSGKKPRFSWIELCCFALLVLTSFRLTCTLAILLWILSHCTFAWHRSHRLINSAFVMILIAFLLPLDIHIPGVSSPIFESTHSGPRLVPVGYGLPRITPGREFAAGGCARPLFPEKWRLVWIEEK